MRAYVVPAVALLSLISFACAEKPNPQPAGPAAMTPQLTPNGRSTQTASAQTQTPSQPTYPKGARYTIYCTAFSGPMHVQEATDAKKLKALEAENLRLKKLVAERDLEIEVMKEIAAKKW